MDKIAADLSSLIKQLNKFKPASVTDVSGSQQRMSEVVEQRLTLHSVRMDSISDFVQEARKTSAENAENIRNLLVGIENLGENVKQLREEMRGWEEPEMQEATEKEEQELIDLMEEVHVSAPIASEQSHPIVQPVSENLPILTPTASAPVLTPPASQPIFVFNDEQL